MEKLCLDSGNGASPADAKQADPEEAKNLTIQNCRQSLVHACHCKDANCKIPNCQKMKCDVAHYKLCVGRKTDVDSPECQQLIAPCSDHTNETKCLVPLCSNNNRKLEEQQRNQHGQLVGGMAVIKITANGPAVTSEYGQTSNSVMPVNAEIKPGLSPTNRPSHQPAILIQPLTQIPPADGIQVTKEIQEEAAGQRTSYPGPLGFATSNGITATGVPYRMINIGRSHYMPMEQWNTPRYPMNHVIGQLNPGLRHQNPLMNSQTQWHHSILPHMPISYGISTPSSGIGNLSRISSVISTPSSTIVRSGQPGDVMQPPRIPRIMTGFTAPQFLSMPGWATARYPVMQPNPEIPQQGPQIMAQSQQQQHPQVPPHIAIGGQMPRAPMVISVPAIPNNARLQFIATMLRLNSPEQQDKILQILKSKQQTRKHGGRPSPPCPGQSQEQQPGLQQSMKHRVQLMRSMIQKMMQKMCKEQHLQQPGQCRCIQPQLSGDIIMSKL